MLLITLPTIFKFMNKVPELLEKCKYGIILLFTFFVPFAFLPFFQNLVHVNIIYVLAFSALLLLILSFVQFLISKKIALKSGSLNLPIILFVSAIFLSFVTTATNKTQAFLDPNIGPLIIIGLSIFYFYGNQYAKKNLFSSLLSLSAFIIASLVIILSLEPKGVGVIPLELIVFFGFIFINNVGSLISSFSKEQQTSKVVQICVLVITAAALIISFIAFLKQPIIFPSLSLSVKALLETWKHPLTAIFGVGLDNYSAVFTRIKDIAYNQTNLWQTPAPNIDRSLLFHIATATGIVGLTAFSYLLFSLIKKIKNNFSAMLSFAYLLCVLVIFPPSFLLFFLIFFLGSQTENNNKEYIFNLSKSFSFYGYFILVVTACVLFGSVLRYIGTMYLADYFYGQSLSGIKENSFNKVYNNQQKAILYNPYLEQYHLGFARTHFILAQNIIDKAASGSAPLVFTKESKQMLVEAIQTAVTENQTALDLNPKKADYWANLAQIYTIIPKELQSAGDSPQTVAINLFKKAISLDPNNPIFYFQMSQIYFGQQNTDEAFKYAKKAAELKSNWPDAHYQLAMLYGQKKDMDNMAKELEITLENLDPKTNQKEYDATKQLLDKIKTPQSTNNPAQPQINQPSQ